MGAVSGLDHVGRERLLWPTCEASTSTANGLEQSWSRRIGADVNSNFLKVRIAGGLRAKGCDGGFGEGRWGIADMLKPQMNRR